MTNFFSIIIPFYNSSNLLPRTIESILKQTYHNYEVIFVDDCSSDNSIQVVNNYILSSNNLRLISNNCRVGAGASRNKALKIAKGRFLIFLDSDDYFLDENSLFKISKVINDDTDVMIIDYYNLVDDQIRVDKSFHNVKFWSKVESHNIFEINVSNIPELLLLPAFPWNKIYNRSYIKRNHITFSETICHNDLNFSWISLVKSNKLRILNNKLLVHDLMKREHKLTENKSLYRADLFIACKETEEEFNSIIMPDIILSYYQKFKWDAFNWGKFRIVKKGLWEFVLTYHRQLLKTPLRERWFFFSTHAISNLERIKFLMICYIPYVYYLFLRRNINKNEA